MTDADTDWKRSHTTDRSQILERVTGQGEEFYLALRAKLLYRPGRQSEFPFARITLVTH